MSIPSDFEIIKSGALGDMLYRSASGLYVPARGTPAVGKSVVIASDGIPEWTDIATQAELTAAILGVGGGGGGAAITLRGSSSAFSASASFTVALPAGSAAGDTAFLFVSSGNVINSPTTLGGVDWGPVDYINASSGVIYAIFRKVLVAADITAGTVTINTSAFACAVALVVYIGAPVNLSYYDTVHGSTGNIATNKPWRTKATLTAGDDLLLLMSTRAATSSTSSIGTLLQNINNTISLAIYRYPIPASGFVDATLNMTAYGFDTYVTRMAVRGY